MKDEYMPYIIQRKIERARHRYPEYYMSHFSKLRQYYLKGKLKSDFTRDDLRDLLRHSNIKETNSRHVGYFLKFACRKDIGIVKKNGERREKFILAIDIKKYSNLQTYINKIGADDYILFEGIIDNQTDDQPLENKVEN